MPKVFTDLAQRYAERPGGYTRIHKYGNRPGDNAPHAILELVDSPRDLRFAMTARAVGWELLGKKVGQEGPKAVVASGVPEVEEVVAREKEIGPEERGQLRPITRKNLQKVLRYRGSGGVEEMSKLAEDHVVRLTFIFFMCCHHAHIPSQDTLLAQPLALKEIVAAKQEKKGKAATFDNLRLKAGQTVPGGVRSTFNLAQGALGKEYSSRWRWFGRQKLGVDKTSVWNQL